MGIQILQYEFLGPISISEWGPPMEKVVYLILGREKDSFQILYAGDCQKTDQKAFFVDHDSFKCWVHHAGSEKSLYLAILPLFEDADIQRTQILNKVISHYKPACNEIKEPAPPPYRVGSEKPPETDPKINCPCCGSEMKVDRVLEKTTIIRCPECGISDTRLNS